MTWRMRRCATRCARRRGHFETGGVHFGDGVVVLHVHYLFRDLFASSGWVESRNVAADHGDRVVFRGGAVPAGWPLFGLGRPPEDCVDDVRDPDRDRLSVVLAGGVGALLLSVIGVGMLAIGAVLSGVVTAPLLSEVFPTRTRYTASAITYNLAYTVFGGTAPLVATWLITTTGNNMSPALYLIVISVMGLIGGLMLPETSKVSLHGAGGAQPDAAADVAFTAAN